MDPQVMYDGMYQFPSSLVPAVDPQLGNIDDGLSALQQNNIPGGFWLNNWGTMDLDQDWSWLMNESVASVPFGMPG
jgi:hypothetical protein